MDCVLYSWIFETDSSMTFTKSEAKITNEAVVIVLCVSVAQVVCSSQVMIAWLANTGFGFLFTTDIRKILSGSYLSYLNNIWNAVGNRLKNIFMNVAVQRIPISLYVFVYIISFIFYMRISYFRGAVISGITCGHYKCKFGGAFSRTSRQEYNTRHSIGSNGCELPKSQVELSVLARWNIHSH